MKRGDVVLVREPGTPASKARPCVVVHRDGAKGAETKVTVCPLTSHLRGVVGERPLVVPTPENRLRAPSEVEVDWIFTHPIDAVGEVIGHLDTPTFETVEVALRRWLDL
jgi:mRNA interferase MazF